MSKVIVLDDLAQEGLDLLAAADGIEYEVRTGLKGDELRHCIARVRRCDLPQRSKVNTRRP